MAKKKSWIFVAALSQFIKIDASKCEIVQKSEL